MKRRILLALFIGFLYSGNILAGRIMDEKSQYGKFEIMAVDEGCKIIFHHNNGKKYELISHNYCMEEEGLVSLSPVTEAGGWKFPLKTQCGEEVHLFETLTAGGGNMCDGYTFWTAFITKDNAWGSSGFGGCTEMILVLNEKTNWNCMVTFVVEPGELEIERKYQAKMGNGQEKIIERVLKLVNKRVITVRGIYHEAIHATNFHPTIESTNNTIFINDSGKCDLSKLMGGDKVKAKLSIKRFDNGREEVTCISIIRISRAQ